HDDRHQEGVFPPDEIAHAPEHQRTERPHQKARRVGRECRQQSSSLVAFRKEQRCEERCESGVEIEVIPLEDSTQRRREDDSLLFWLKVWMMPIVSGGCSYCHGLLPVSLFLLPPHPRQDGGGAGASPHDGVGDCLAT